MELVSLRQSWDLHHVDSREKDSGLWDFREDFLQGDMSCLGLLQGRFVLALGGHVAAAVAASDCTAVASTVAAAGDGAAALAALLGAGAGLVVLGPGPRWLLPEFGLEG